MPNPISISLSSVGTSRPANLDWRPETATSYSVTGSSSGSFAVFVEGSLDDLQLNPSLVWATVSSATFVANSSFVAISQSAAALRLNSSALSGAVLRLKVLQGYSA
jgi:hypothetical protein